MDNAFPCIPLVVTHWKKNISHMWGNLRQWPYLILCFNNYFGALCNFQHCWACWLLTSIHCFFEQFTYFENVNIASVLSFPSTQHLTAIHTKKQKLERRWDLNSIPLKMAANCTFTSSLFWSWIKEPFVVLLQTAPTVSRLVPDSPVHCACSGHIEIMFQ